MEFSKNPIFPLFAMVAGVSIVLYVVYGYRGIIYEPGPLNFLVLGIVALTLVILRLGSTSIRYSKHFFLPLFAVITGVSIFQNYTIYYNLSYVCGHSFGLSPLCIDRFWQLIMNCCGSSNYSEHSSLLYLAYNTDWFYWILELIVGIVGLSVTSFWIWKHRKVREKVAIEDRQFG
ncbi:MAG: hypothetical protein JRN15_23505 [Nitrososphaerota archaeon]|nr:hypothetical protein [Nitrososphaerota archaeon]